MHSLFVCGDIILYQFHYGFTFFFFYCDQTITGLAKTKFNKIKAITFQDSSTFHCIIRPTMPEPFIGITFFHLLFIFPNSSMRFFVFRQTKKPILHTGSGSLCIIQCFASGIDIDPNHKSAPVERVDWHIKRLNFTL